MGKVTTTRLDIGEKNLGKTAVREIAGGITGESVILHGNVEKSVFYRAKETNSGVFRLRCAYLCEFSIGNWLICLVMQKFKGKKASLDP